MKEFSNLMDKLSVKSDFCIGAPSPMVSNVTH